MSTLEEKIEVMQAYKDGKQIEIYSNKLQRWVDWTIDSEPDFNWELYNYRIKEEPKKKVKLYQVLLKYVTDYHISLKFFKTEQEAIYHYDGSGFIVIKLLPHTMIDVEED